jgi:NAD-dependent DNA ligase
MNKIENLISRAETCDKEELYDWLQRLDTIYYSGDGDGDGADNVSDEHYDRIRDIYETRFGPFQHVGAAVADPAARVRLPYWLGSMDKIKSGDRIEKWMSNHPPPYLVEEKLDGVSALYLAGDRRMYTRGDGAVGADISTLIPHLHLPSGASMVVRGEIIIKRDVFKARFQDIFKNARNLVSGVVNAKDRREDVLAALDFIAYEVLHPVGLTASQQRAFLTKSGFQTPRHEVFTKKPTVTQLDDLLHRFRTQSQHEIDGIVVSIDGRYYTRNTSGNPAYAFAYKNVTNLATTRVEEVLWRISKHGQIKPRVRIQPVDLAGATITFATGFNARYIRDHKVGPGAIVEVTRSGDVIPFLVRVLQPATTAQMPTVSYEWNKTGVDIIATEGEEEDAIFTRRAVHFFSTLSVRGMAEKTIEKIVSGGYRSIGSILSITADDLKTLGFGDKESSNLLSSIHTIYTGGGVDTATLMAATSFFGFGIGARKIQLVLDEMDVLSDEAVTLEKIAAVSGWSTTSAESFLRGLTAFREFVAVEGIPLQTRRRAEATLTTKKFVFSGFRDKEMERRIEAVGGKVVSSVSKDTSYVVVKDAAAASSSKTKKAIELGIAIITEKELHAMM